MGKSAKLKSERKQNRIKAYAQDSWIDTLHRETDLTVSITNAKERDRLVEVIKKTCTDVQSWEELQFSTQLFNLENLVNAAVIVKAIPEFSNYYYCFGMKYNGDPSMGYIAILKHSPLEDIKYEDLPRDRN